MAVLEPQVLSSTQDIVAEITHKVAGIYEDPTVAFTGYLAFMPSRYPEPADDFTDLAIWHVAAWESARGHYFLRMLRGAKHGGLVLTAGRWHVFCGLDGPVQCPIMWAGVAPIW